MQREVHGNVVINNVIRENMATHEGRPHIKKHSENKQEVFLEI